MVALETRPQSFSTEASKAKISPHTKRMLEIKVERLRWYKSMNYSIQANLQIEDIKQYALKNAPRTNRREVRDHRNATLRVTGF